MRKSAAISLLWILFSATRNANSRPIQFCFHVRGTHSLQVLQLSTNVYRNTKTIVNAGKKIIHTTKYIKDMRSFRIVDTDTFPHCFTHCFDLKKTWVSYPGRNILVGTKQSISIKTTIQTIYCCDIT
jgi:hypothetical protein